MKIPESQHFRARRDRYHKPFMSWMKKTEAQIGLVTYTKSHIN